MTGTKSGNKKLIGMTGVEKNRQGQSKQKKLRGRFRVPGLLLY
jgi:hypothetical protein